MVSSALYDITGGDPVQMQALIREFRLAILRSIEDMKATATEREWRDCAHRLKGGALAIGADHLAAIAADAESGAIPRADCMKLIDEAFAAEFPE